MKRAFPAYCPAGEGRFLGLAEGVAHYASQGFKPFDADSDWMLMRKDGGAFEAYIRRLNLVEWAGSVVQLRATHE